MTLTAHAIVGATLATAVPAHPALAFALGFGSHFLLDAIPHWDYHLNSLSENKNDPLDSDMKIGKSFFFDLIKIGADCLLGFGLVFIFFWQRGNFSADVVVFLGALGAVAPDALQFLYFKWRHQPIVALQKFHIRIHSETEMKNRPMLGILSQVFLIIFVVILQKIIMK